MTGMHDELRDSARQVMNALGAPAGEEESWRHAIDLGWLLATVPEDAGGIGLGLSGACVLHAELGRGLSAAPFLPAMLAIDAVAASDLSDRDAWIERLTTSFAVTAPLATSGLSLANGVLNGVATAVQSADQAEHVLVCTPDLVALAPLGAAEIVARPTWDETRRLFDVRFANVKVGESLVLARGAGARLLALRIAAHRDFAIAADAAAGASALLDMTIEYLKTRRQFGRPLALFQALKHRCADLKAQTLAAEALLWDCLGRVENGDDAALPAKLAKQLACAVYARVGEEAIQLHGGIAMTSEHVCHRYVKRALLNEHLGARADDYELDIAASVLG